MRLQSINLRNIGAYYGLNNQFDFSTSPFANVVLIGGKNGSGKTTLLEAIRVVLFGSLTYGYMTENDAYYSKISTLFNRKALENNESQFQINLVYESTENFLSSNYDLSRLWKLKNGKIKESFTVRKDGRILNERETDNFQNRIKEEFPPRLFELCLFDGEEISRIISDGRVSEYLKDAATVLFNLDLFSNLDRDLNTYKYSIQTNDDSDDLSERLDLESLIAQLEQSIDASSAQIQYLQSYILESKDRLSLKKRDFEIHGGLHKEEREKIVLEISHLENTRKHNTDQIRTFIINILPLYLVRELVSTTNQQINEEQSIESYNTISSKLTSEKLNEILIKIASTTQIQLESSFVNSLHQNLLDEFKPKHKDVLHRASFAQRTEINYLNHILENTNVQTYVNMYNENLILLDRVQELKQKLDISDNSSEFKNLITDIEELSTLIENKKLLLEQVQQEENHTFEKLQLARTNLDNVLSKLAENRKTRTSFVLAEKISIVSRRFQSMQLRKKLDQIQNEAIQMINRLFRKKEYISRLYICHETFELILYNQQEILIKERLSAGEKEMLMLSIIWAMFKCTRRQLPLVFDTLFGRLDKDHKRELINHYIPHCGEQVIILATDSEISNSQFVELKPHLSRHYTLDFNTDTNYIIINENHYFDIYDMELK